jgi:hypothetical protein
MRVTMAMQSQSARGRKKVQMHIEIARTAMMLTEAVNNIGEALAMVVPQKLRKCTFNTCIVKENGWILISELQGHSLQVGFCSYFLNLAANSHGACDADLSNFGMGLHIMAR